MSIVNKNLFVFLKKIFIIELFLQQGEKIGIRPRPIVSASVMVVISSDSVTADGQQPSDS